MMNLFEVSQELSDRLTSTFLRDEHGRRPVYGGTEKFQSDPHWRDYLQFFEYFHADNGAGLGASHQTGWTALIAPMIESLAQARSKSQNVPALDAARAAPQKSRSPEKPTRRS